MQMYIAVAIMIVFDVATGLIGAFATNTYKSTKMREGLYHKLGLVLCVIFGFMLQKYQGYVGLNINVPIASGICVYISLMEISSVLENLCKINPELMPKKLTDILGINRHE